MPNQSPSNKPGPSPQAADIDIKTLIINAAEIMDEDQFRMFLDGFLEELRNADSE